MSGGKVGFLGVAGKSGIVARPGGNAASPVSPPKMGFSPRPEKEIKFVDSRKGLWGMEEVCGKLRRQGELSGAFLCIDLGSLQPGVCNQENKMQIGNKLLAAIPLAFITKS